MSDTTAKTPKRHRDWLLPTLVCLGVAAVLRGVAVTDAFWLDEIWTLHDTRQMVSVFDAFTWAHDNNHQLVTVWIYALGDASPILLRLPSLVAGLVAVGLVTWMVRHRGVAACWMTGGVFAVSFLMVVYSSEARGYGLAVCFALAAYQLFVSRAERGGLAAGVGFGALVILGMMSHFGFVQFYVSLGLWHLWRVRSVFGRAWMTLLTWHAAPVAYLAYLYFAIYRGLEIGGGNEEIGIVLSQLVTWGLGSPEAFVPLAAAAALAILGVFVTRSRREGRGEHVFFILMILVVPVVTLQLTHEGSVYPRYFLLSLTFLLLAICRVAHWMFTRGGGLRILGCAILGWLVLAGLYQDSRFLREGRGQYRQIVEHMVAEGRQPVRDARRPEIPGFTYGGDQPWRTELLIEYYKRYQGPHAQLLFVHNEQIVADYRRAPEWFLVHPGPASGGQDRPFDPRIGLGRVGYGLDRVFPAYGPSGWIWALYHRL